MRPNSISRERPHFLHDGIPVFLAIRQCKQRKKHGWCQREQGAQIVRQLFSRSRIHISNGYISNRYSCQEKLPSMGSLYSEESTLQTAVSAVRIALDQGRQTLTPKIHDLTRALEEEVEKRRIARRLMTIPESGC